MTEHGLNLCKFKAIVGYDDMGNVVYAPFYGWPDRPDGGVLCSHSPIDNGTKVSECSKCRQRMVFEFPEWRVSE